MAGTEVALFLTIRAKGLGGMSIELPHVPMNYTILEVKKSVLDAMELPNDPPESLVLFHGTMPFEDEKLLRDYNRSKRSRLQLDVYDRVDLYLQVKTLQREQRSCLAFFRGCRLILIALHSSFSIA